MPDWYAKRTFGSLPAEMASRFGEREALVFEERRFSFAEIAAEVERAAKALIAAGVEPGDKVSLWLNNRPEWIVLMFAIARVGAVQVPINTRFRTKDLEYVLRQSDSTTLITHHRSGPIDYLKMVREVVRLPDATAHVDDAGFPELERVVIIDEASHPGTLSWDALLRDGQQLSDAALSARTEAVDPDDPVLIMYTSGTTGFPKGVTHNHKLIRNVEERGFRLGVTESDVILNYLPLFHAFGYSEGALLSMLTGARQVLTEIFDPDACIELIERERVTMIHGFETHLKDLTEAQERARRDISTLRAGVFAAGTQSATPIMRKAADTLAPLRTVTGFGMTEVWVGASIGSLDDDLEHRCETSGYPAPGYECRVVHPETGEDCAPGEPGELLVRGYGLMLGYYKKPEETARTIDAEGWLHSGDSALRRTDGYIRFLGRYKDMLKVGGENVDPMEVEGLLLECPGVHQVAVVGLAHERLSEVPVAFVQPSGLSELAEDDVIDYCRGKVASFKLPRHVVFVPELPMTPSGKIRKIELREIAKRLLSDKPEDAGPADG